MKSVSLSRRTYQRNIPIFISSFIIGVLLVHYFVAWPPLETLRGSILTWTNIVSLLVWSFAIIGLLLAHSRRLAFGKGWDRSRYETVIVLAALIFFLALGLSDPKLDQGPNFSLLYMIILGRIQIGTGAVALTYFSYNVWRRVTSSRLTPEIIVFLLVYIFSFLRQMSLATDTIRVLIPIGDWIEQVVYATGMRALTIITAIGTLMVATRALVGKEPGMIEMEVT